MVLRLPGGAFYLTTMRRALCRRGLLQRGANQRELIVDDDGPLRAGDSRLSGAVTNYAPRGDGTAKALGRHFENRKRFLKMTEKGRRLKHGARLILRK